MAVIALDNSAAHRQAKTGARLDTAVYPFERNKNRFKMLRLDSHSVIADRKDPLAISALSRNMNLRRSVGMTILHGVQNEILEQQSQRMLFALNRRQMIARHCR